MASYNCRATRLQLVITIMLVVALSTAPLAPVNLQADHAKWAFMSRIRTETPTVYATVDILAQELGSSGGAGAVRKPFGHLVRKLFGSLFGNEPARSGAVMSRPVALRSCLPRTNRFERSLQALLSPKDCVSYGLQAPESRSLRSNDF